MGALGKESGGNKVRCSAQVLVCPCSFLTDNESSHHKKIFQLHPDSNICFASQLCLLKSGEFVLPSCIQLQMIPDETRALCGGKNQPVKFPDFFFPVGVS